MKSIQKVILFSIAIIQFAAFTGCDKNDKSDLPPHATCNDNIQNQGELGIDCGGPCDPCQSKLVVKIDGQLWESGGAVTTIKNGNSILILSGNGTSSLSLIYTGNFTEGSFNLESASYTIPGTGTNYLANTGNITFLSWNLSEKQVFGTFSFDAFETSGSGDTLHFRDGQFWYVPFQ